MQRRADARELLGRFRKLTSVRLPGNEIGSAGFAALAPALTNASHLDLRGNELRVRLTSRRC